MALRQAEAVPGAMIVGDTTHSTYDTLQAAFGLQGAESAWHIEDDAELTARWAQKAAWLVQGHPDAIIQTYSSERADLTRGERWRGPPWGSSLCFHWPGHLVADVMEFAATWEHPPHRQKRHNDDMLTDYLRARKLKYWNAVPSLVTHRAGYSARSGRYWHERPSLTFER